MPFFESSRGVGYERDAFAVPFEFLYGGGAAEAAAVDGASVVVEHEVAAFQLYASAMDGEAVRGFVDDAAAYIHGPLMLRL